MSEYEFRHWLALGARTTALGGWDDGAFLAYPYSPYWCLRLKEAALALSALCSEAEWSEIVAALPEYGNPRDAYYLFSDLVAKRQERNGLLLAMEGALEGALA